MRGTGQTFGNSPALVVVNGRYRFARGPPILNPPLRAVQSGAVKGSAEPEGRESALRPLPADTVRFREPFAVPGRAIEHVAVFTKAEGHP